MTLPARALYLECLFVHYGEGAIPADLDVLSKLTAVSVKDLKTLWPQVSHKFIPHPDRPGFLVNEVATKHMQYALARRKRKAEAGRKGAQTRWEHEEGG